MGDGGEGVGKDGRDSAGMVNDVQGDGSAGAALQELELGSNGCNDKSAGGVPQYSGLEDCRDVIPESQGGGGGGGGIGGL